MKAHLCFKLVVVLCFAGQPMWAASAEPGDKASTTPLRETTLPRVIGPVSQRLLGELYPEAALREKLEGLVFVRFDLDAQGRPYNLVVEDEGFQVEVFGPAALRVVKSYRFEPATKDGVPVESQTRMPVRFGLRLEPGITREFRAEVNKVVDLLDAKDYAGAHVHAQWMLSEKARLNYEYAVLKATLANTLARTGEIHAALEAVRSVTKPTTTQIEQFSVGGSVPIVTAKDFLLPLEMTGQLLELQFVLAASQGLDGEAAMAYAYLQGLGLVTESSPATLEFRKVRARLESAPRLEGTVRVGQSEIWRQQLVFGHFALRGVEGGEIRRLVVDCGVGGTLSASYSDSKQIPETVYTVPQGGTLCTLDIFAPPGTTMRVVEYRQAP
jgi:TonB family protein